MLDRIADRLCAWAFGPIEAIDFDVIETHIEQVAQFEHPKPQTDKPPWHSTPRSSSRLVAPESASR